MRKASALVVMLGIAVAACSGWGRQPIPFDLTDGVESVLTDWRTAGLSCGDPQVGMPGPAADWVCRGRLGGIDVSARLIADSFGVQSVHAGVPPGTPGAETATAFVRLVQATSLIDSANLEIEAWLLATDAADGTMPTTGTTQLGRASIASESGHPTLYIVPLGSSMLLMQ